MIEGAVDFDSVRARLRRAAKLRLEIADLQAQERRSPTLRVERQRDGSKVHFVVSYTPTGDIEVIFGDWLHNARSALDHLFFQLTIADTGKNPPPRPRARQFPIGRTRADFDRLRETDAFYGLSRATIDAVESMQPYHTKYGSEGNVLLWLHDHARSDRHRTPWKLGVRIRCFEVNLPNDVLPHLAGWKKLDPQTTPAVVGDDESLTLVTLRFESTHAAQRFYGTNTLDVETDLEVINWYRDTHQAGLSANIRNDSLESRMTFTERYLGMVIDHFETLQIQ
ncbi:hypothetical protein [Rhodococcus sp. NPDC058521]|uniref:hypothetical protein n=1 Tax=Rhodococcus sp. NPDC058521 TaxID=3346536 RepID=UPI00366439FB